MRFGQDSVNRQSVLLYGRRLAGAIAMLLALYPPGLQANSVTFTNPNLIDLTDPYPLTSELPIVTKANPYPSTIPVAGFAPGTRILDVNVILNNVNHTYLDDLDVLLVGPTGAMVILVSNVSALGAGINAVNLNWSIDNAAAQPLRNSNLNSSATVPEWNGIWTDPSLRSYRPSDYDGGLGDINNSDPLGDFFDLQGLFTGGIELADIQALGPLVDLDTPLGLNIFNGTDPNGTWSLYVVDDYAGFGGSIGSWSLQITATPEPASIALMLGGVAMLGVVRWRRGAFLRR